MTAETKTQNQIRQSAAYRFEKTFLEKLTLAAAASGITKTNLIEKCVENSLHRVLASEREKRNEVTRELNAILESGGGN